MSRAKKPLDPFASALGEGFSPSVIDAFTPLGYTPSPKQRTFHELSQRRIDAILYGGAEAGGKSCAALMEALHCAVNFPGMKILCLRRTYPELEESFLAELKKRKYALALDAKWNQTDKKLRFTNGSEINFSYAESELDISRILGGEYQLILIDEASRNLPIVIKHSEENLRSADPSIPVLGIRLMTNPGGTGGSYLKQRFIVPTQKGAHIATDTTGRTVAYVPAVYTDNPHINQEEYKRQLDAIDDPARRAAMRDGDWDAQIGQFFEQWRYDRHVIDSSESFLPLPQSWQRYAGVDWGTHAPFACVWAALDENGRMWVYKELYAAGVDTRSQAQAILALEERDNEREVIRSADPSMWANRGTPMTNADVYGLEGCGLIKADNDRPNGWARCHHYLNDGVACEYHAAPPFNWETCPMLHVFGDQCPSFVEWIPALERDKHNPDDADTKGEDHMPDAWRYLCMTASVAGGPVFYENDKNISQEDIRRLLEEERAAYLPAQVDVRGPFAYANLGIKP